MKELIKLMQNEDHFALIKELGLEMCNASEKVLFIHDEIASDIRETRQRLPIDLAQIQILVEVLKTKFAISEIEWKEKLNAEIEKRSNKLRDFSDMEF